MSDRPEDVPEWAWGEATNVADKSYESALYMGHNCYPALARAILKAREEAFEEAAKIAEEYGGFVEDTGSPPSDFTNSGKNEAATDIASAIRQHSQKGER